MKLTPTLECIPNVSEGRRPEVIEKLADAITNTPGVQLLHKDVGYDANRTVFTFVGQPSCVVQAAKNLAKASFAHIDLRQYSGTHPYIGALDVCPLVPLWGLSPKLALTAALEVARYSAEELKIPVYLYEQSATRKQYKSLANIRKGGFRKVALRAGMDGPDFGNALHPTAGASVIGAREILIAYNVCLNTKDVSIAKEIARKIRTTKGTFGFKRVRAIGWVQEKFNCAQVSINLLSFRKTGLAEVFMAIEKCANELGASVTGSEMIGLVPEEALLTAGKKFSKENEPTDRLIEIAIEKLGLNAVKPFFADERILERAYRREINI